jgi:hypothetical protein
MKKTFLTFCCVAFFFVLNAQQVNPQNWQNAILRADGLTQMNGVEAFCAKVSCDNEDYILIKFQNNNNYRVRVEWTDGIFVNGVWYYAQGSGQKAMMVDAGGSKEGSCTGEPKLKVKISSIIANPSDFQHYAVSGLTVK